MYITCIICCCVVTSYMFWLCIYFITCVYTYYLHDVIYVSTVLLVAKLCNDKIFIIIGVSIFGAWLSIAVAISLTYGICWVYMSPGTEIVVIVFMHLANSQKFPCTMNILNIILTVISVKIFIICSVNSWYEILYYNCSLQNFPIHHA